MTGGLGAKQVGASSAYISFSSHEGWDKTKSIRCRSHGFRSGVLKLAEFLRIVILRVVT